MKDTCKTKEQLIRELEEARKKVADLERSPSGSLLEQERARLIAIMVSTSDLVATTKPDGRAFT